MDEEKLQDKSGAYPAAEFLAPYALEDYQRLQKRYDDISRRAGIALLASIVTMAGMLYRVDCSNACIRYFNWWCGFQRFKNHISRSSR